MRLITCSLLPVLPYLDESRPGIIYLCVCFYVHTHIHTHTYRYTHTYTPYLICVFEFITFIFGGILCVNVFCKFICAFLGTHTYTHSRTHLVFFYCVCSYQAPLLFSSFSLLLTNICLFFHI